MNDYIDKYSLSTLENLDITNIKRIINFLEKEQCTFINELLEDYLDLFTIDYDLFVKKYCLLNKKYGNLLVKVQDNMNILEEFFYDEKDE